MPPVAKTIAARTLAQTDKAGRIKVNTDLTVPGYSDIYVTGDLASLAGADGKPLPGVVQVAMQQGAYAAKAERGLSLVTAYSGVRRLPDGSAETIYNFVLRVV
jgi:NADH dehydrogenase